MDPSSKKVTFDTNGGEFVSPTYVGYNMVVPGNQVGNFPNVTRNGYSFSGWSYVDGDEPVAGSPYDIINEDRTYIANWIKTNNSVEIAKVRDTEQPFYNDRGKEKVGFTYDTFKFDKTSTYSTTDGAFTQMTSLKVVPTKVVIPIQSVGRIVYANNTEALLNGTVGVNLECYDIYALANSLNDLGKKYSDAVNEFQDQYVFMSYAWR